MKLKTLKIMNHKSFHEEIPITFSDDLNIIVGPNGGGKSNLSDIITIVLRTALLHNYRIEKGESQGISVSHIRKVSTFHPTIQFIEKYLDDDGPSSITIELEVSKEDVNNIQSLIDHISPLASELARYSDKPFKDFASAVRQCDFKEVAGHKFRYKLENGELVVPDPSSSEYAYLKYLNYLEVFLILHSNVDGLTLSPPFLYFPPYRSIEPSDLSIKLAHDNFNDLLQGYLQSTSRTPKSLLKLGTLNFPRIGGHSSPLK